MNQQKHIEKPFDMKQLRHIINGKTNASPREKRLAWQLLGMMQQEKANKAGTCEHGYPPSVRCSRCGE